MRGGVKKSAWGGMIAFDNKPVGHQSSPYGTIVVPSTGTVVVPYLCFLVAINIRVAAAANQQK